MRWGLHHMVRRSPNCPEPGAGWLPPWVTSSGAAFFTLWEREHEVARAGAVPRGHLQRSPGSTWSCEGGEGGPGRGQPLVLCRDLWWAGLQGTWFLKCGDRKGSWGLCPLPPGSLSRPGRWQGRLPLLCGDLEFARPELTSSGFPLVLAPDTTPPSYLRALRCLQKVKNPPSPVFLAVLSSRVGLR